MKPGDCVTIYMPMIPELAIAMLACARIGAMHSVVFGGFSAQALIDRIGDARPSCSSPPTADSAAGKIVPLKETADAALKDCPPSRKSIVVRRTGEDVAWQEGRDLWWHELGTAAPQGLPRRSARLASTRSSSCTPAAPPANRKASCIPPRGYLLQTMWTSQSRLRLAGRRCLLVYRRYRLGDRP